MTCKLSIINTQHASLSRNAIDHVHMHTHNYFFQEFCRRSLIPHIVVLSDKELFFERKQVKVRTLEPNGKASERIIRVSELTEFLQLKHGTDRSDSVESQTSTRLGGPSNLDSFPSNVRPPVNVHIIGSTGKLSGHYKRKIHDAVSGTI